MRSGRMCALSGRAAEAFTRRDWTAFLIVALISFATYLYTLAPSVTLEDAGELITGAVQFGVPHPPGYPLWSLFSFFFSHWILPLGNWAWRINVVSAVFGALASGLVALLASHSTRWLLDSWIKQRENSISESESSPDYKQFFDYQWITQTSFFAAIASGLIIAWSDVMWSQSVIAEVYTLNAFFLMSTLTTFYRWVRSPGQTRWLLASVLVFSLGLTNHHTLIILLPAFVLAVGWIRPRLFPSFLVGLTLFGLSALTVLTWYSQFDDPTNPALEQTTQRVAAAALIFILGLGIWHCRRFSFRSALLGGILAAIVWIAGNFLLGGNLEIQTLVGWSLLGLGILALGALCTSRLRLQFIGRLFLLGWIGLLPYAYMPFASSTNPPMNWGFASSRGGFYNAFNRGQYDNNLAATLVKTVGRVAGADQGLLPKAVSNTQYGNWTSAVSAIFSYWHSLEENFSLLVILAILPALYLGWRVRREVRSWLVFLLLAFLSVAFLLSLLYPPLDLDRQLLWIGKTFNLQSHCLFALGLSYGLGAGLCLLLVYLKEGKDDASLKLSNFEVLSRLGVCLFLAISFIPLCINLNQCSQRGHWFGWRYGYELLHSREPGAVIFGGTDAGRFIPTYMIFCESQQPARWKRDANFDRRDLYIITQNALASTHYLNYIRFHYDARWRPTEWNAFERWLGRDHQYPTQSLSLPDTDDWTRALQQLTAQQSSRTQNGQSAWSGIEEIFAFNGLLARHIFESNKLKHAFYVEESMAIPWMYDYAVPAGALLKLTPQFHPPLTPEIFASDRAYWTPLIDELVADPRFSLDPPAQGAFAKLRLAIGNLYRNRGFLKEAEHAYRDALRLDAAHPEATLQLSELLQNQKRFEEAVVVVQNALALDPNNRHFQNGLTVLFSIKGQAERLDSLEAALKEKPAQVDLHDQRLSILWSLRKDAAYEQALSEALERLAPENIPAEILRNWIDHLFLMGRRSGALRILSRYHARAPGNLDVMYNLGMLQVQEGAFSRALPLLSQFARSAPEAFADALRRDARWKSFGANPEFRRQFAGLLAATPRSAGGKNEAGARTNTTPSSQPAAISLPPIVPLP